MLEEWMLGGSMGELGWLYDGAFWDRWARYTGRVLGSQERGEEGVKSVSEVGNCLLLSSTELI
jgi:hypothetical protein